MSNEILYLVGIIVVVCEAIKRAGVRARFIPLISILLGIGGSLFFFGADFLSVASGVLTGLGTTLGYREIKDSISE